MEHPLLYTLLFLKEWMTVEMRDEAELHGMVTDPMVLKDANGRFYIGKLMYDAMYDKWFSNPEERLNARKYDTFSNAFTELMLMNLRGAKSPAVVRGQFIQES